MSRGGNVDEWRLVAADRDPVDVDVVDAVDVVHSDVGLLIGHGRICEWRWGKRGEVVANGEFLGKKKSSWVLSPGSWVLLSVWLENVFSGEVDL